MIKTWSFSRISDFEKCKQLAKLKYIDKIPEPPRPLPAGKTEHANDRGTRIHEGAELFVKGGVELIPELKDFAEQLEWLRDLYSQGKVSLEGEWAHNREWLPVAWASSDVWCRMKLDAFVTLDETHGLVVDYKTGKRIGNEIKHTEQGQLYQLSCFLRYPKLEVVDVEFWYTDQGETDRKTYTREQGMLYMQKFEKRGTMMTECLDFPPNPNRFSCKWCPYNGNACLDGVKP